MPPPEADQLDAEKRALREAVRAQIASISPTEAARRSRAICQAIAATGAFARARTIMAYLPIEDGPLEVDPRQLGAIAIARGKRLCYPRMDWDRKTMQPIVVPSALPRAEVRRHNVPEPTEGATVDAAEVDLVIVPGVAFDAARHRLGRGGDVQILQSRAQARNAAASARNRQIRRPGA